MSLGKPEDLSSMYKAYNSRKEILLWLKVTRQKRPLGASNAGSKKPCHTNHEGHLEKMTQVQVIVDELEKCHGTSKKYSPELFRAWAHMLQLKKHDSYDMPLNKPFFKSRKQTNDVTALDKSLSPGKRISYCTECIEQIGKWHSLMEKGAISHSQFQELQLCDIKNSSNSVVLNKHYCDFYVYSVCSMAHTLNQFVLIFTMSYPLLIGLLDS